MRSTDPFGKFTYAIDGTGARGEGEKQERYGNHRFTSVREFYERSLNKGYYWIGVGNPETGGVVAGQGLGWGNYSIVKTAKAKICRDYCVQKAGNFTGFRQLNDGFSTLPIGSYWGYDGIGCPTWEGEHLEIDIVGWSRGAVAAVTVAKMLNDEGCECESKFVLSYEQRYGSQIRRKTIKPVPVRFLGLFDAVSQQFTDPFSLSFAYGTIPSNVETSAALWRTADLSWSIFPQHKYSGITIEHDFYVNGEATSHGQAGRYVEAAEWMINQAIAAEVPMKK